MTDNVNRKLWINTCSYSSRNRTNGHQMVSKQLCRHVIITATNKVTHVFLFFTRNCNKLKNISYVVNIRNVFVQLNPAYMLRKQS